MKFIENILNLKAYKYRKEAEEKERHEQLYFVFPQISIMDGNDIMPNASSVKDTNAKARRS